MQQHASGELVGEFPFADKLRRALNDEGGDSTAARIWPFMLAVWLLTLIATPISIWTVGLEAFPLVASIGVVAQFAVTIVTLACVWDVRRILVAMLAVAVGGWLAEFIGHQTNFPFGAYHYTELLQPQVGGVPLLIPMAWMMMLGPAWGAAATILGKRRHWLMFALVAGLAMTAWDLYLDPQMVAKGLWIWDVAGSGYFGIPWSNYAGWVLVASLLTLAAMPKDLPNTRLLIVYTLTWLFQAIGLGIFWGQPGPAAVGFIGMGAFALAGWWKWSSGR